MPCSDGYDRSYERGFEDGKQRAIDNELSVVATLQDELQDQTGYAYELEAILCAICHELRRRDILEAVLLEAESQGEVEIFTHLKKHWKKDEERILQAVKEDYSNDEIALIKDLVQRGKL